MWQQNYTPLFDSVGISALAAAAPIFVVLLLLGVFRKPAWMAAIAGLLSAIILAAFVYGMPGGLIVSASTYGAAFGLFPICWILFWAIVLYRITVDTGNFSIIKDSIGSLTGDRRLQALLIAFAFGAFIEGAAGFGAPVAVAAGMLAGLGFDPFFAAGICLLANTAPVAFGSIGIPVITLAGITGLPLQDLSANVGRICAPVSAFVPAYLVMVMNGWRGLKGVLPAAAACGISFAAAQFLVSNYLGPQLTDILGSLAAMASLIVLLRFWKPADALEAEKAVVHQHTVGTVLRAWIPYAFLVILVLLIGVDSIKTVLNQWTMIIPWPNLHNEILRVPPAVKAPGPYTAPYMLNFFTASGTACMFACFLSALALRMPFGHLVKAITGSARQLALPLVTVASVLALAFLMNYCGATATLGLAFAATGVLFPFFSSLLGWLGVFLTGSDTSANALFGNLQVVTAGRLDLNPVLMAASNSSGGVMGKMISLQSIAVAAAAAGMPSSDESRLFRFTLKHSIFLASVLGLIVVFYAYVAPHWVR
jgi:L-lactate transport